MTPPWRDPDPADDWTARPLSDGFLASVLIAALAFLLVVLAVVVVWS